MNQPDRRFSARHPRNIQPPNRINDIENLPLTGIVVLTSVYMNWFLVGVPEIQNVFDVGIGTDAVRTVIFFRQRPNYIGPLTGFVKQIKTRNWVLLVFFKTENRVSGNL